MIGMGNHIKVLLWSGAVDMRKGFDGLSVLVQEVLKEDPFSGICFAFRNKRGNRLKMLFWDGSGFVLAYKRLDRGTFYWPPATGGKIRITQAELSLVFEGIDWRRMPLKETNKPTIAA
jgi:transposase